MQYIFVPNLVRDYIPLENIDNFKYSFNLVLVCIIMALDEFKRSDVANEDSYSRP